MRSLTTINIAKINNNNNNNNNNFAHLPSTDACSPTDIFSCLLVATYHLCVY